MNAPVDNPVLVEVYTSGKNEEGRTQYRWRATAANNRKLATGGEGFSNIGDLLHSLTLLWPEVATHVSVRLPRRRNSTPLNRALTLSEDELR